MTDIEGHNRDDFLIIRRVQVRADVVDTATTRDSPDQEQKGIETKKELS
jgi:hypothetical protein